MEAQTPSKAISNKTNGRESETVAAEKKVTQRNNSAHGQKSTYMFKFLCFCIVAKDALLFPY